MLTIKDINKLAAQKGVSDVIVEKDYILDWMLWGVAGNSAMRNNLVFKGGTALHKMYFPDWRFSEDLDFTTINSVSEEQLKTQVSAVISSVTAQSGIQLKLKSIERSGDAGSDWSYEIKVEYVGPRNQTTGPLPIVLLHITHDELVMDEPYEKLLLAPYPDLPTNPSLLVLTLEEVLSEKLRTCIHQRCYPKDIYDTWRIVKESGAFLNLPQAVNFYKKKSAYRKFAPDSPAKPLSERIARLQPHWVAGLKKQINNLPEFQLVSDDIQSRIASLLKLGRKTTTEGGCMLESNYMMKYQKGDLCVEVQGDKAFVEDKFKWLLDLKVPVGKSDVPPSVVKQTSDSIDSSHTVAEQIAPTVSGKPVSLAEFLNSKQPKSHYEKILCFGYFFEKMRQMTSFTLCDIYSSYHEAKEPLTKNFSPYIITLVRDGRIMTAHEKKDGKKAWQLTNTGLQYVEQMPIKK
ncbi:MAG: nucleotidyl transferase AbiEii/AbiGii toxin family protein [Elusimicrobiales bacterium]|nr:nucleotidyl transferase AbiEii/AbiGii toxin family protein [Elusimicrobiales bacterium]